MAMSGMRQAAVGLGVIERTPPEAMLLEGVPTVLRAVPEHRRTAFIEFAHWGYGALAGAAFGLVPSRLRASRMTGPLYGLLSWGLFELALAPALDLAHAHRARPQERLALLVDHVFFGLIVGAPPEADIVEPAVGDPGEGDQSPDDSATAAER
ncbi:MULTISPECIES: hypothetical protein [Nocardiopsis]|uniref:hypothetical protein n=1 Tax=Nocardiopsis TaxID=2013 RepID=UPI000593B4B2|nr:MULTISPECIES: hypothetical protein [Nocardiopsis]